MQTYKVTIRAGDNHLIDFEVQAQNPSDAMDIVFDQFSGDIREAWCDTEYYC
jgi:hypothetical protein